MLGLCLPLSEILRVSLTYLPTAEYILDWMAGMAAAGGFVSFQKGFQESVVGSVSK